jgi:triosephosphate isomerase
MTQREDARTPFVAGNWKMHMLRAEARAFAEALAARIDELDEVDLAIAAAYTSLSEVADVLAPLGVGVFGQNAHAAPSGAFTGEVSMAMLVDAGATGVLLGHSERRQYFGETDEALADKVPAALAAGLDPILCVGETAAERESGATAERLTTQLTRGLANIAAVQLPGVTIAYEPVWAIGTGQTATPELAQDAHAHLRAVLAKLFGGEAAEAVRIQYGGSMKPQNAAELLAQPDIDGGLIGGASLVVDDFVAIAAAATPRD